MTELDGIGGRRRVGGLAGARMRALFGEGPDTLRRRAAGAGLWALAGMAVQHPLRLAGNLMMARLLAPEAFGLMAAVMLLHTGLALVSEIGIVQSVVRSERGREPRFLAVAWTVQILRGLVIAGCLVLFGFAVSAWGEGLAGTVYADPRLPGLIWVSTLAVIAKGFDSANMLLARRDMRIGRVTLLETGSMATGIAFMVAAGAAGLGVQALVAGMIVTALMRLALSHTVLPGPRMHLTWDRAQVAEMWTFGRWLIGAALFGYLINNADRLVFGAQLDGALFGVYAIAAIWTSVGMEILNKVSYSTVLPSISRKLRSGAPGVETFVMKVSLLFTAASVVVAAATAAVASLFVRHLYPEAFDLAAELIPILCLRMLFVGQQPLISFFVARGESRVHFLANLVGAVWAVAATWLAADRFGLEAGILAYAVTNFLGFLVVLRQARARGLPGTGRFLALNLGMLALALAGFAAVDAF